MEGIKLLLIERYVRQAVLLENMKTQIKNFAIAAQYWVELTQLYSNNNFNFSKSVVHVHGIQHI